MMFANFFFMKGVENTTPSITECEDTISKTAHWPQACNFSAQCPFDIEEIEEETCLLPTKCKCEYICSF